MTSSAFKSISRRLLLGILLASSVITTLVIIIAFYMDYSAENDILELTFSQIEKGSVSSLGTSIWDFNEEQIKSHLGGIIKINDVVQVAVYDDKGNVLYETAKEGFKPELNLERKFEIGFVDQGKNQVVGTMKVVATRTFMYKRLRSKLLYFTISQIGKTLLISYIILVIIRRFVTNNITSMQTFFENYDMGSLNPATRTLQLKPRGDKRDEFDVLAERITVMSLENMRYLALANEQAKISADLEAVKIVQQSLFPSHTEMPGFNIQTSYIPAAKAGGDWYIYSSDPENDFAHFCMGDVTGHGLPAALVTAVASGAIFALRSHLTQLLGSAGTHNVEEQLNFLAQQLNTIIRQTGKQRYGMTMLLLTVNTKSGEGWLLSAGHCPPFHARSSQKSVAILTGIGSRIGFTVDPVFAFRKIQLEPGDIIFMYTDGFFENARERNARKLHKEVLKILSEGMDESCTDVHERIIESAKSLWGSGSLDDDDVATLLIRWKGNSESPVTNLSKSSA
jgi:serine phosphatase RsbU (regulator of sigma subunit)